MSWCCHEHSNLARQPADGAVLPVLRRRDPLPPRSRRVGVPQLLAGVLGDLPRPSATRPVRMSTALDLAGLAAQASRDLEGASALDILTWAHHEFGSNLVVASSMADTVMIHLAEQVAPGIDV